MSSREKEIVRLEEQWLQAHLHLDIAALDDLMHPDYRIVKPDGSIWDKTEALVSYRDDSRNWDIAEISDLSVRLYASSALVTGLCRAKGQNKGEDFDYRARYLWAWIADEQGTWKLVHDQSVPLSGDL